MIHHSEIIADLARVYRPKVYVELGLYTGENWYKVLPYADKSFGVDIVDRSIQGGSWSHYNYKEKQYKSLS